MNPFFAATVAVLAAGLFAWSMHRKRRPQPVPAPSHRMTGWEPPSAHRIRWACEGAN